MESISYKLSYEQHLLFKNVEANVALIFPKHY